MLTAAEVTDTMQENVQEWFQLDEGEPGYQFLWEEESSAVIFFLI
jgi:hypothetical protein